MIASFARKLVRPLIALATVAAVGFASEAKATFSVTLSNVPGGGFTVTDGGAGDLLPGTPNRIVVNQLDLTNGYNIFADVTYSESSAGTSLRLNAFTFSNNTGGAFTNVTFTALNTATLLPTGSTSLNSALTVPSGTSGVTYSLTSSISNTPASTLASITAVTFPATASASGIVNPVAPFDFSGVYTASSVGGGATFSLAGSFSSLSAAPAPLTAFAALSALPMLGGFGLMRRRLARKA